MILMIPHFSIYPEISSILFKAPNNKSAITEALLLAFIAWLYAPTFMSKVFTWLFHS